MKTPANRRQLSLGAIVSVALTITACSSVGDYEIPNYTVVESFPEQNIEIREYPATLVAEVTVEGSRGDAANQAFRPLFNYISGANVTQEEIEMTAPVTQEPKSVEIEMTAPVTQAPTGEADQWEVAFIMPSKWTLETLPAPKDDNVRLREIPGKRVAAIRFSGSWSDEAVEKQRATLEAFLDSKGYQYGAYQYAFYDAPFTLPAFRRNEVLYELKE